MAGIGRIGPAASSRVAMGLYRQRIDQRVGDDPAARAAAQQAQAVRQAQSSASYGHAAQSAAANAPRSSDPAAPSRYTAPAPAHHAPPAPPPHRGEPTSRDRDLLADRTAAASIAAFQDLRAAHRADAAHGLALTQDRDALRPSNGRRGGSRTPGTEDVPKPTAQEPPSISTTGLLSFLSDFR